MLCCAKLLQSCLTLCDPMAYSPLVSSSVQDILQARIVEWTAMPSSNKYICINNYFKCKWTKCVNQKT